MTTFDKREEGFEQKFAHDEELRFKATARRNKLVGLWAAEHPGSEGVFGKLRKDFDAKGVAASDAEIRQLMNELLAKAAAQIQAGK